jgi:hypothetical protein
MSRAKMNALKEAQEKITTEKEIVETDNRLRARNQILIAGAIVLVAGAAFYAWKKGRL